MPEEIEQTDAVVDVDAHRVHRNARHCGIDAERTYGGLPGAAGSEPGPRVSLIPPQPGLDRARMHPVRIDLHTHSSCSDGTDTPAELVANAVAAGLHVLALTDHDTTAGWAGAEQAAERHGIALVKGIELSTRNQGRSQHLLGYGFDPTHPAITEMLTKSDSSRQDRIEALLAKLAELDKPVDRDLVWHGVEPGGVPGRAHVASAMVEARHVPDTAAAFREYLNEDAKAYVQRYAPSIEDAIQALRDAGGVAVIAHPRGKRGHVTEERFAELAEAGLSGIEVDHQEHPDDERTQLRAIAANLNLVATGSSDYHGTRKDNHDLGCDQTPPEAAAALLGPDALRTYERPLDRDDAPPD